jgi:hypothetical protein
MKRAILAAALAAAGLLSAGSATSDASHVPSLHSAFTDNPFTGGQVAPRSYRWVNERASVFAQFDNPREPTALRYVGIGVKGTFCAESQPRGANGGFTHFHRVDAPAYAQGHGGPPEAQGYWLMWVAVDAFAAFDGRPIAPGVDYAFSPTPPPSCGGPREPSFEAPGAHRLSRAELRALARLFPDRAVAGGAERRYRWVTGDTVVFLEFDRPNPRRARAVRYIGVAKRGVFCRADRPTDDFSSFEPFARVRGDRRPRRGTAGLWHLGVAVDAFRMPWGRVRHGVDREYYATRAPSCPKGR